MTGIDGDREPLERLGQRDAWWPTQTQHEAARRIPESEIAEWRPAQLHRDADAIRLLRRPVQQANERIVLEIPDDVRRRLRPVQRERQSIEVLLEQERRRR